MNFLVRVRQNNRAQQYNGQESFFSSKHTSNEEFYPKYFILASEIVPHRVGSVFLLTLVLTMSHQGKTAEAEAKEDMPRISSLP